MEENAEQKIFKFRDARQERIHQRLHLVGSGVPSYFKDICRLIDTQPPFETTTHLASHLIREIETSLRNVLLVFIDVSGKPKNDGHKWEIRQILKAVDIPDDNPIAALWLRHAPTLAGRAHRDNLLPPRPADETFQQFLDEMESVFDVILTSFESKYLSVHDVLDTKLQIDNPTNADAAWLKTKVPNNQAALGYFIDRLNNPNWLAPLQAEGLFQRPPEPIYEPEKNTTFFPPWSLSKYLIRMSKLESADVKNLVGEIVLGIEATNFMIHLDLVEAACSLLAAVANQIAEKELVWLRSLRSIGHLIPDKFSDLAVYLAKLNHHVPALQITQIALGFVPAETNEISAADNYFGPDPQTRMDRWDYGQFIHKSWEPLTEADWQGSLNLFCGLLVEFLERKYPERVERAESYSYIWHHAIEHNEDGLPNRLVSTIRSIAELALATDPSRITQILENLEGYQWDVFGRIGLHLLRLFPADAQAETRKRLLSEDNFRDVGLFHEYVLLLVASFQGLDAGEQGTILSWIDDSALSIEEVQKRRLEWDGRELSVDDAEKSIRFAKLKWLEPLKDVLGGEWLEKYTAWTAELGTPDHPSYMIGTPRVVWGGEPDILDVLTKLQSPEEITKYLSTPVSESPQELARELSKLVSADPNKFIGEAERFKELEPVYVRGVLSGAQSGLNELQEETWARLVDFLNWVMAQPATELDLSDNTYDSVDKDWVRTRAAVGELVSVVLSQAEPKIPFELREELWNVIYELTNDPNPTEAYEARYGGTNMDPLTSSLNTIRGTAFHTLFKYLNWCRKQLSVEGGFDATPEVREVLERHVDFQVDRSLAVRAVYGERLPWLASIAPDWVAENFDKLFPKEQEHSNFCKSVWETFINYTQPYDNVFEVLRNEYGHAIERLGEESLYNSEKSANHLAEHLNVLYIRGEIGLGDGGLIDAFYARASDDLAAHVFWFAGQMLKESILPPEMEERLSKLVEHRIANGATHPREMESFGSIFVTEKLDAIWSLQRLRETLEISPFSEPDHMVIEILSKLAPDHPQMVLENTSRLVDGADADWKLQYWSPHLRSIIQTASQTGAVEQADVLINKLAAKNLHNFRDLLSGGQEEN